MRSHGPTPLLATLLLGGTLGCAGAKHGGPNNLGTETKEHELLSDSARLYWEAVRWGDGERAGAFVEDVDERVLFMDWLEEDRKSHRLEEAVVLQVVLGPELDPPEDGHLRTGTVHVRVRGYSFPAQIVEDERVSQTWYRTVQGWHVDWDLPEQTASKP